MLINILKQIKEQFNKKKSAEKNNQIFLTAKELYEKGEIRLAIKAFREYLAENPLDTTALNNLGCCLDTLGDRHGAGECFKKAITINDADPPLVINQAKYLVETNKIKQALPLLEDITSADPDSPDIFATLGSIYQRIGNARQGVSYDLKAWLGNFDTTRFANCYLFHLGYCEDDEKRLAAEHKFWAKTLPKKNDSDQTVLPYSSQENKKIRLAYWSPDLRNHSVRYFFLPIIANHNREKFEVFTYHDFPISDEHTKNIEKLSDNFFSVFELPDSKLSELIKSHKIDVLIELAGHTSANRLEMLSEKLAKYQITGIGYPATTGLNSIDAKIVDKKIITKEYLKYYTEEPLVLEKSFWCFDPFERIPAPSPPPCSRNGFITFGCFGNIAKITKDALQSWKNIQDTLKDSRLIIRSISFDDEKAIENITEKLNEFDFDLSRVELLGPAPSFDLFISYNQIDITLDTFPFNGGTTTCFSTYMGVPVITLSGHSLISRMGLSIMESLGLPEWVASNWQEYTEKAIYFGKNPELLKKIRSEIREKYNSNAIGNGAIFTQDFEEKLLEFISRKKKPKFEDQVEALPLTEIIARTYTVLRYGQFESARRIIDYCLEIYPRSGIAHILKTYELTSQHKFYEAAAYLNDQIDNSYPEDRFKMLINIARFYINAQENEKAEKAIQEITKLPLSENIQDVRQLKLLKSYFSANAKPSEPTPRGDESLQQRYTINVILLAKSDAEFQAKKSKILNNCLFHPETTINFENCQESWKRSTYIRVLSKRNEFTIIVNSNITIENSEFFSVVVNALKNADMVGYAGARAWEQLDWELSSDENKSLSVIIPSGESPGKFEINMSGAINHKLSEEMNVLNGNLLGIRNNAIPVKRLEELFDIELEGGGSLLEQYFTYLCHQKIGSKLVTYNNLGIVYDWQIGDSAIHASECRKYLSKKLGFDPLNRKNESRSSISVTVNDVTHGMQVIDAYFKNQSPHF